MQFILVLAPLHRGRNWGSGRLKNLARVIKLQFAWTWQILLSCPPIGLNINIGSEIFRCVSDNDPQQDELQIIDPREGMASLLCPIDVHPSRPDLAWVFFEWNWIVLWDHWRQPHIPSRRASLWYHHAELKTEWLRRWFMVTSFLMTLRRKQGSLGEGPDTPSEEGQGGVLQKVCGYHGYCYIAKQSLVYVSKASLTRRT